MSTELTTVQQFETPQGVEPNQLVKALTDILRKLQIPDNSDLESLLEDNIRYLFTIKANFIQIQNKTKLLMHLLI